MNSRNAACYNECYNAVRELDEVGEEIACSDNSAFMDELEACKSCEVNWGANINLDWPQLKNICTKREEVSDRLRNISLVH